MNKKLLSLLIALVSLTLTSLNAQTYEWTKTFGGSLNDNSHSVSSDLSGNVYVAGTFKDTVDFDPGTGTDIHSSHGKHDVFVQKLDANGNFQWAKTFGSTESDYCHGITTDAANNVYITGIYQLSVDFDPSSGIDTITSNGQSDVFLHILDENGNYQGAKTFGGLSYDSGVVLAIDNSNNIFLSGVFSSNTVDFDPGNGVDTLSTNGSYDVFLMKLSSGISSLEDEKIANNLVTVFPNPAQLQLNLKADDLQIKQVSISDMSGKTLKTVNYTDQPIQINDLANGIYFLKIETNKGISHKRFVKQ